MLRVAQDATRYRPIREEIRRGSRPSTHFRSRSESELTAVNIGGEAVAYHPSDGWNCNENSRAPPGRTPGNRNWCWHRISACSDLSVRNAK